MLTEQQAAELKNQLRQQISHLPADKKAAAEEQITSLSLEALEEMLEEQKERQNSGQTSSQKGPAENKSIFRRVVDGDVPSVKIEENSVSVAVMDITPISKGHMLIVPKKAVTDAKKLPTGAFTLAKKLSSRVISKLKASTTEIQTENKFGEAYIHIIPSYDTPLNINSGRKSAKIEELEEVAKVLRIKKRVKPKKPEQISLAKKETAIVRSSRRIP